MDNSKAIDTLVTLQFGTPALVDAHASEWRALCQQSETNQPFYYPEFIAAFCRAFAPSHRVVVITARQQGQLVAVLPLIEERASLYGVPVKKWRSPSNFHTLRFDIACAPGVPGETGISAIWKKLAMIKDYDLIELQNVPQQGAAEQLLNEAAADGFPAAKWVSMETPYIPLQAAGERSWQAQAKHSLVVNVNKCTRKIIREKGSAPVFSRETGRELNQGLLRQFYAIEEAGWKGKNGTAISSVADTLSFYNEVADCAAKHGYFCLDALHCGNELVGASFSFVANKKYYALKWAYNEEFTRYSAGHLLINGILDRCTQEGFTEFDFMGPNMEYKAQWTQLRRPQAFIYLFQKSLKGQLLHGLKFGLVPRVRDLASLLQKKTARL